MTTNNDRTEEQAKILEEFYTREGVWNKTPLDKITALETVLGSVSNFHSFSFDEKPMPIDVLDSVILKNIEDDYLASEGALFIQYA